MSMGLKNWEMFGQAAYIVHSSSRKGTSFFYIYLYIQKEAGGQLKYFFGTAITVQLCPTGF